MGLNGSQWAEMEVSAWLCPFLEDLGENPLPCLFQLVQAPGPLGVWPLPWSLKPTMVHQVLLKAHHSDTHFSVFLLHPEGSLWLPLADLDNPGEFSCFRVAWLATCEPRSCEYVTLQGRGVLKVLESKM